MQEQERLKRKHSNKRDTHNQGHYAVAENVCRWGARSKHPGSATVTKDGETWTQLHLELTRWLLNLLCPGEKPFSYGKEAHINIYIFVQVNTRKSISFICKRGLPNLQRLKLVTQIDIVSNKICKFSIQVIKMHGETSLYQGESSFCAGICPELKLLKWPTQKTLYVTNRAIFYWRNSQSL